MSEQELKLHVPQHSRHKIQKYLGKADKISLRAMYFDTSDRQLAKAKVAIRLRQEGDEWVQTLKMAGANSLSRIEMNHRRQGPVLDLSLYAGTAAETILAKLTKPLELRYETDVLRLYKIQRTRTGRVEIAYDTGFIRAGRLELPLNEVEFELKSGDVQAIFDIGLRWIKQYDLILDTRTKSHRGDALASMMAKINEVDDEFKPHVESQETARFWAERKARPYALEKHLNSTQALCRLTEECIEQIAMNAAYLAEVDTAGVLSVASPEHVHQLRIGMRRLASNWRLFNGAAHLPDLALQTQLKQFLAQFGATRDTDVMLESIMPSLQKAGMPNIEIDHYQGRSATDMARDSRFQVFLVKLLAWVATTPLTDPITEDNMGKESNQPISNPPESGTIDFGKEVNTTENDTNLNAHETDAATKFALPSHTTIADNSVDSSTNTNAPATTEALSSISDQGIITTTGLEVATDMPAMSIIPLIPSKQAQQGLRKTLEKRLNKWNKAIISHWKHNDRKNIEAYHDLRKRIKRMRYGLNVYEGVEGHANLNAYVKRLAHAQEVFGALNDHATALNYFTSITDKHPEAWFAVGWLSAQLTDLKREADVALKRLPKKIIFD
ncbi:CYTH and CHAD domain-containing protein [Pelistega europaea]|uniref:CYTH and CHAD domain-containing protein n=1 Tax=Pelistega europaea TaxID=106147 RepID=A0A7Y4LBI0_9BURK|nr:CYTH and CHAD domain-containing protein [Pelistega europaea]NOL50480.1 CYTH and CHAD domain-containing protein [Pelistega europaea]